MKSLTITLSCFFSSLLISAQVNTDILSTTIRTSSENTTVQNILNEITKNYSIVFSYEPSEIPLNKQVMLPKEEMLLKDILNVMFQNTGITYSTRSSVIILKGNPSSKNKSKIKHTISGIIKDSKSSETLIGATVYIDELKVGEITNEYGFYSLTLPEGAYQLRFSFIGYETLVKDTSITSNIRLDIELYPEVKELQEVVITKQDKSLSDFHQNYSFIEMKTLKELPSLFGESDVIRNILLQPGVNSMAELGGDFQVRGGSWDQNLMMLDEALVYNSNHLLGLYSTFNPDIIKDIKFYKAGIPANYGGRLSSVMDISQKEGNMKSYHISGGIGLIANKLSFEGPIVKDKASFIIAARRSTIEPFMKYAENENARRVKPYFYDINSKANYIINRNNRIYLSCYIGKDLIEVENFNQDYGNITGTLRYNHIFGEKLFSNTSIILSTYKMFAKQSSAGWSWKNKLGLEHYELKNEFVYFLPRHKFDFGLRAIYYTFHPGEQQPEGDSILIARIELPKQNAIESAVYVNDNFKISSKVELNLGVRFSNYNLLGPGDVYVYQNDVPRNPIEIIDTLQYKKNDAVKTYNNVEPRFTVKYKAAENQTIAVSYNRMVQYIQLVSRTFNPLPDDMWKPSNSFIKPLQGHQYSVGWYLKVPSNSIDISVESYYKTFKNVLEVKPGAETMLNSNLDAGLLQGAGRAYGIEFALNKTKGRFTGTASYTWSKSEKKIDGNFLEEKINYGDYYNADYDIPNKIALTGEYKATYRFYLTANFIYQTGRPVTYPAGQYTYFNLMLPYFSGKNKDRYPPFHRLDIGAVLHSKKKEGRKWEGYWTFSVYNIYGRKNYYFAGIRTKNNSRDTEAIKMWFFSVVPSISYSFKF